MTVELQNGFGRIVRQAFLVLLAAVLSQTASSAETRKPVEAAGLNSQNRAGAARFAGNFMQVEITLNDEVTLADISAVPSTPESAK
jgi:hypothetical protein